MDKPICTPIPELMTELYLIELLERVEKEFDSTRMFLSSREKGHPLRLEFYDELHEEVKAAIKAYQSGKWRLHVLDNTEPPSG